MSDLHDTPPEAQPEAEPEAQPEAPGAAPGKALSPAARRALEEAAARRAAEHDPALPPEKGGRDGPEPTRFGDWEKKGVAVDF
ncbi:DUF1674 domain-containing protein [Caulobacter sp.]|uniref:DUF1674 domain-containing protein n=1 Tax=Caulobacter sp. TaxID=78 RepID=UPI002B46CA3C|nr:DUF1674 domain-containing protein [Caulobacter sp.]HJV41541.1 DUF1674 domain-containing protein [Caulobacter sp.]